MSDLRKVTLEEVENEIFILLSFPLLPPTYLREGAHILISFFNLKIFSTT